MESPQINVAIEELSFSLFQRPLHPELFNIYASRRLKTEKYEALIWVTGCTHVISVFAGDVTLSEVVSPPSQPLPERGLLERFQFRGPRSHKCTLSKGTEAYLSGSPSWKWTACSRSVTSISRLAKPSCTFIPLPHIPIRLR